MTPEERRAEIDSKFPFHVDLLHQPNDWDAAREKMDFLITFIATFDMYVVTKDGQSWVRHCFATATDVELFKAYANKAKEPAPSYVVALKGQAVGRQDERMEIDAKYPHHVDLSYTVDEQEADDLADFILSHIGWFGTYDITDNGKPRSRFCFETADKAEMFRLQFGEELGCRSSL